LDSFGDSEGRDSDNMRTHSQPVQEDLLHTAEAGEHFDKTLEDEEREISLHGEHAKEDGNELHNQEDHYKQEHAEGEDLQKKAGSLNLDAVKGDVDTVKEKAGSAISMAKDYHKEVGNLEKTEKQIKGAEDTAGGDIGHLFDDKRKFDKDIKALHDEEDDMANNREPGMEKKLSDAESKFDTQMAQKMVTLSASSPEGQTKTVAASTKKQQIATKKLNDGVSKETDAVDKIDKKTEKVKTLDQQLEDHQKTLDANDAAIEKNSKGLASNIHIVSICMFLFIVGAAALHNTWRVKIEKLEKETAEYEKGMGLGGAPVDDAPVAAI